MNNEHKIFWATDDVESFLCGHLKNDPILHITRRGNFIW